MENAALNALYRLGIYFSMRIPFGGIKGFRIKGETELFPGVKICRLGMASIIARYSDLVGSIARNGMPLLLNCSNKLMENVVLPVPGIPTIKACFEKSFAGAPMETLLLLTVHPNIILFELVTALDSNSLED